MTMERPLLTPNEVAELRDAVSTWRTVQRIISGGFAVLLIQTSALIAWGVSVESRLVAEQVKSAHAAQLSDVRAREVTEKLLSIQVDLREVRKAIDEHVGKHLK